MSYACLSPLLALVLPPFGNFSFCRLAPGYRFGPSYPVSPASGLVDYGRMRQLSGRQLEVTCNGLPGGSPLERLSNMLVLPHAGTHCPDLVSTCPLPLGSQSPPLHQYVHTQLNGYTIMFHDFIIIIVIISAIIAARVTSLRHSSTEGFTVLVPYLHRTFLRRMNAPE